MKDLGELMTEEDFSLIIIDKTVHSKYQSRLCFGSKEDTIYINNKYSHHLNKPENWKWTTFKMDEFKIE